MVTAMEKLIQLCASANDLFGLDGDGAVYQYNFNTNTWMRLGRGRSDRRESWRAQDEPASGPTSANVDPPPGS
jgi:hypothetical protein